MRFLKLKVPLTVFILCIAAGFVYVELSKAKILSLPVASELYHKAIPDIDKTPEHSNLVVSSECNNIKILTNDLPDRDILIHPMFMLRKASNGLASFLNLDSPLLDRANSLSFKMSSNGNELLEVAIGDTYQTIDLSAHSMDLTIKPYDPHLSYLILENASNKKGEAIAPFYFRISNMLFMKNSSTKPLSDNGFMCDEIKFFNPDMKLEKYQAMQMSGVLNILGNGWSTVTKEIDISGIRVKKDSNIYVNTHGLLNLVLAEDTTINHVNYKGGTSIELDSFDYFSSFVKNSSNDGNIIIDGIEYKAGTNKDEYIVRHSNNRVSSGILAKDTTINGVAFSKNTRIRFSNSGALMGGILSGSAIYNGMEFTHRPDSSIKEHGSLDITLTEDGSLTEAYTKDHGPLDITFSKDGVLAGGYTGKMIKAPNVEVPADCDVTFYKNGHVKMITIYKDEIIKGLELTPYRPCYPDFSYGFSPVIIFSAEDEYSIRTNESFKGRCD